MGIVGGASTATVGGSAATGAGAAGGAIAISPAIAVTGAGLLGYGIGTLAYPIIEPQLSKGIDWICSTVAGTRTERCNEAFKNCKGWRRDPKWIDRCARSLMECLNHPGLPVIFPNGDIVK